MAAIEFVVRCRKTPVEPQQFLAALGLGAHVEFIPAMIVNALFVANGHRDDTRLHLVLEKSADFSRILTFDGGILGDLGGLTEAALLKSCSDALSKGRALAKDESREAGNGIWISGKSFERLLDELTEDRPGYLLDPKGQPASHLAPIETGVFALTDQLVMPKNTVKGLIRKGLSPISLGKTMLYASQCITLIHGLR